MSDKTSARVATIAGETLKYLNGSDYAKSGRVYAENLNGDLFLIGTKERHLTVELLRTIAASCLTQAPDKKRKAKP